MVAEAWFEMTDREPLVGHVHHEISPLDGCWCSATWVNVYTVEFEHTVEDCKVEAFYYQFDSMGCGCCCPSCCYCYDYYDYDDAERDAERAEMDACNAFAADQIKTAWIWGVIPSVTWPDEAGIGSRVRAALATGEYVVDLS